ncbi:MAG: acetoacetate decarboxylase family protein [bacterium]
MTDKNTSGSDDEKDVVKIGKHKIELPITYKEADVFSAAFTVSASRLEKILPSKKLRPMISFPGRAVMMIAAMNYRDSSIGPYGEAYITFPVYYKAMSIPILSPLFEMRWPGTGMYVLYSMADNELAVEAGKQIWKQPKIMSDIKFTDRPGINRCELKERDKNESIIGFSMQKTGRTERYNMNWRTYTIDGNELLTTDIKIDGVRRIARFGKTAELHLTDHPISKSIQELDPSPSPIMSSYYVRIKGAMLRPHRTDPIEESSDMEKKQNE